MKVPKIFNVARVGHKTYVVITRTTEILEKGTPYPVFITKKRCAVHISEGGEREFRIVASIGASIRKLPIVLVTLTPDPLLVAHGEALMILSKGGKVQRKDCHPIAQATWDAFERGYMKKAQVDKRLFKDHNNANPPTMVELFVTEDGELADVKNNMVNTIGTYYGTYSPED